MVSSILKATKRRNLCEKRSEQAFETIRSEKEREFLRADIESDSSDDDFWGEDDILEKKHKIYVRKKSSKARQHPENRAINNDDFLRCLEQLEKCCCESIEGTFRTFWMLFEDIVIGAGNNHYNAQNLSKSIGNDPSLSSSRHVPINSVVVVGRPRRMSNEAKAAYLLQKLKETKPLSFSDEQSHKPSSGDNNSPMLRPGDEVASNPYGSKVDADTMIPLKAESRTRANHITRKDIAKDTSSTTSKGVKNPIKNRLDALKSDLERQYAALKHYHPLENGYEEEFADDFGESTLVTPIENEHQDRSHNCKPTFMQQQVASNDDDTCSLEELGHFVEFRDTDLAFLENQLERQGSLGSVVCCTETKKRLQNITEDEDRCLVDITPNVAMFVLPQRSVTG